MKPEYQLSRPALIWQMLAVMLVVVPHQSHLPGWVPLLTVLAVGWRFMVYLGRWSFPHWLARGALAIGCGVAVVYSFGNDLGMAGMVALLVVGFSLKSLEMYKRRDALMVIFVAYVVATTLLLFEQSILVAAYVLLCILVISTALVAVYQSGHAHIWRPMKKALLIIAPAVPLMLVLFLVMPRLAPLWTVQSGGEATTGLAESMSPGDIARLTRSAAAAFRAEFSDTRRPSQARLYWRVMTYADFDGRTWANAGDDSPGELLADSPQGRRVTHPGALLSYAVTLEPTQQHYLPALDLPLLFSGEVRQRKDFALRSAQAVSQRLRYQLSSAMSYRLDAEALTERERYLQLPPGNLRSRQLAASLLAESGTAELYIERLLQLFNARFSYSLTPPRLGQDSIDQFLFDSRSGFCGHFAGAMAFLLRAVGIPSRIVAGYQGGEWSPDGGYLLVRQYDAHAWLEAWLPGRGWIRLDPTSAVAPERVEQPAQQLFAAAPEFLAAAPLARLQAAGWLRSLGWQLDAINYAWQGWVLNYQHRQAGLLRAVLGDITSWRLALALLLPFALVLALVAWQLRARARLGATERMLHELLQRLASRGLGRLPGESLRRYLERVAELRPDLAEVLRQIGEQHERLYYSGNRSRVLKAELQQAVLSCRRQL